MYIEDISACLFVLVERCFTFYLSLKNEKEKTGLFAKMMNNFFSGKWFEKLKERRKEIFKEMLKNLRKIKIESTSNTTIERILERIKYLRVFEKSL